MLFAQLYITIMFLAQALSSIKDFETNGDRQKVLAKTLIKIRKKTGQITSSNRISNCLPSEQDHSTLHSGRSETS